MPQSSADAESLEPLHEATISALHAAMADGRLTSAALVEHLLARVADLNHAGPNIRAVIETNPDARAIAATCDDERQSAATARSPLHGIPIILKDNIETADKMLSAAGSLALADGPAAEDATVAARLRKAGAILFGKANLSEWANFRSTHSFSGWSARGGRTRNPYALDRNPSGSSSGSAAAVAAGFAPAALGTETDGSVISPSNANGVVGLKPTVGLTSRAGVVPISHSQDTVGVHARSVRDAALVLSAIAGPDPRDPATQAPRDGVAAPSGPIDYAAGLSRDGLRGARLGVARAGYWGYSAHADRMTEAALEAMRAAGAEIVDPADLPSAAELADDDSEFTVLACEFKADINAFLAERAATRAIPHDLAALIAFNEAHAERELPFFGQEIFEMAQAQPGLDSEAYRRALAQSQRLGGRDGIAAVLHEHHLDALVVPAGAPAWLTDVVDGDTKPGGCTSPSARAGYPIVSVPAGFAHGLPVSIAFLGGPFSEPTLLRLAYAFEQLAGQRAAPRFLPTISLEG